MDSPAPSAAPDEADAAAAEAGFVTARTAANARSIALVVLATLAVFYTLSAAEEILLPFLFAAVLNLLLAPAKRLLTDRLRLPAELAALLLLIALFIAITAVFLAISVPASTWLAKAPDGLKELQQKFSFLGRPIAFVRHGMDQWQHLIEGQPSPGQQTVAVQSPANIGGIGLSILLGTRAALGQVLTLAVVLFFLLAAGDSLLRRLVEVLPSFGEKRRAVEIANEIERNISGYLVTITVLNLFVGAVNGLSMWVQGVPDPLLWGTLAFLLNYIPILGPLTGMVIFFFVGLFSTPTILQALLPPAVYLAVHVLEGQAITPMLLARRFTLNPVMIILSLFFWDWMWGVAGAFLAVPLLAITKIIADRIPALEPLGHLLGGPPNGGA